MDKENPGINICDDGTYKEIEKEISLCMDLTRLREVLKDIINQKSENILKETERLESQGYDMRKMKIVTYTHTVPMMLKALNLQMPDKDCE